MKSKRPSPKTDGAIAFVIDFLASGSRLTEEVTAEAKLRGITPATLDVAAKKLKATHGLERGQLKGNIGHFWTLPKKSEAPVFESALPAKVLPTGVYKRAESAWPLPSICPSSRSVHDNEVVQLLQTANDPLIRRLLDIIDSRDAEIASLKAKLGTRDTDAESEYNDIHRDGYRTAIIEVETLVRNLEGELESPEPCVTNLFAELSNRIDKLVY